MIDVLILKILMLDETMTKRMISWEINIWSL